MKLKYSIKPLQLMNKFVTDKRVTLKWECFKNLSSKCVWKSMPINSNALACVIKYCSSNVIDSWINFNIYLHFKSQH